MAGDERPVEEAVDQAQATAVLALDVAADVGTELRRAIEEQGRIISDVAGRLDAHREETAAALGGLAGRLDELALRSHEHAAAAEPEAPATEPVTPAEAEDAGHMTVEVEAPPKPPKKRRRFERARKVFF